MEAIGSIRGDTRLRGNGAQAHEDCMLGLRVGRKGWDVFYDPAVLVDHYMGQRDELRYYSHVVPVVDEDAFKEGPYNWVINLWDEFSPLQHVAFILWNFFIGTRVAPGLVQAFRFTPALGRASWHRFWLTQAATYEAYKTLIEQRPELPTAESQQVSS
jgi:hypothetical protein